MVDAIDSRSRQWKIIEQAPNSMECGFACAAMACFYYQGAVAHPPLVNQVAMLSKAQPGHGTQGIQSLQNLAHVLNQNLQVTTWNAENLGPYPAGIFARIGSLVSTTTPAIVGLNVTDASGSSKHLAVAIDFDAAAERMFFLDPYPGVGVVEMWEQGGAYPTTFAAGTWALDGWVLCTHH